MKSTISQEQISKTAVRLGIPDVAFTQRRIARAFDLVATDKVSEVSREEGLYRVHSQYDDKIYTVEVNHGNPHCTCPDGKKTVHCKHMIASMLVAFEGKQNKLVVYDDTFDKRKSKSGKRHSRYGRWIVNDYRVRKGYVVYRDEHEKLHCACGKKKCRHCKAIRKVTDDGAEGFARDNTAMRIENECGTSEAKALQEKLNGNNGTGDNQSPSHHQLDRSDPFQECEQLDIDQIEGRSNGDLVHVLSNGEYVVSYRGIMNLANKHGVTFDQHTDEQEAKETRTVIAYGRCGGNSRASGKPANGNFTTAVELAKRNAARQLLPLPEIKALEHKAKLERGAIATKRCNAFRAKFDWEVAKRKCLEIVPDFTLDILIHDLVQADTLRQAHPSDYNRKEWLLIFDACKRDAEINGNDDDDGGDDTPSPAQHVTCCVCNRTLTNPLSVSLEIGPECRKNVHPHSEKHIEGTIISDELVEASKLYQDEAFRKRIIKACLTLDAPPPVKVLRWLGNEYFGYKHRPFLYYVCADGQLNRIDTSKRKLRHAIVTRDTAETELDAHALAQPRTRQRRVSPAADVADPSERKAEVPDTMDEFVERCKQAEATVEDTIADDADTLTNGDGKQKLVMGKDKNITLVDPDGTHKPMTFMEVSRTFGGDVIMRLTQGIQLCGADISTVEWD